MKIARTRAMKESSDGIDVYGLRALRPEPPRGVEMPGIIHPAFRGGRIYGRLRRGAREIGYNSWPRISSGRSTLVVV